MNPFINTTPVDAVTLAMDLKRMGIKLVADTDEIFQELKAALSVHPENHPRVQKLAGMAVNVRHIRAALRKRGDRRIRTSRGSMFVSDPGKLSAEQWRKLNLHADVFFDLISPPKSREVRSWN